jgi:hypothetical protein
MKSLLAIAALIICVRGHGGIYNYTIDGVDYAGYVRVLDLLFASSFRSTKKFMPLTT